MLRTDLDRRVAFRQQPDLHHLGVGYRDAAVGPVTARIVLWWVARVVGQAVDHDSAAGCPAIAARAGYVGIVGVGDLNRQEEIAAGIAADQPVAALGRAEVALA